jgi:hypothetical protein
MKRTLLALMAAAVLGCTDLTGEAGAAGACDLVDSTVSEAAFVIATAPPAGATVRPGFAVSGCSRTFESNVNWRLLGRDGGVLGEGFATGGGVDGPAPVAFTVDFSVDAPQIGHLEVFEVDASDGEGFPPGRTVLPLVLTP